MSNAAKEEEEEVDKVTGPEVQTALLCPLELASSYQSPIYLLIIRNAHLSHIHLFIHPFNLLRSLIICLGINCEFYRQQKMVKFLPFLLHPPCAIFLTSA